MIGPARLLLAVLALLCLCPAVYPEPVRLIQEKDWSAPPMAQVEIHKVRYVFNALGTEILIDAANASAADALITPESAALYQSGSLEKLFISLVRTGQPAADNNADRSHPAENIIGVTPGFFNPETYQSDRNARLLIPLDILFPLLGGPLFFDTLNDPLSRFTVEPGTTNNTESTLQAVETHNGRAESNYPGELIALANVPEQILFILAGFALAMLPAIFRSLKMLARMLPALPGGLQHVVSLLRNKPVDASFQDELIQNETESGRARRRKVPVRKDESWRRRPVIPVKIPLNHPASPEPGQALPLEVQLAGQVNGTTSNGVMITTEMVAVASGTLPYLPVTEARRLADAPAESAASHPPMLPSTARNGDALLPVPQQSEAWLELNELLAISEDEIEWNLPEPEDHDFFRMQALATTVAADVTFEKPQANIPAEKPDQAFLIAADAAFEKPQAKAAEKLPEPDNSSRELRTGAMLAWLEERYPSLTEAVAWENDSLAEFRGLPFAEISVDDDAVVTKQHSGSR